MIAGLRARVGISVLLLGVVASVPVSAQQSAEQTVLDLNHGAMDAYNNMDINKAGSMLEEALRVATQGGVSGPLLAQTDMNLAIVYIGGLGDNDSGLRYFMSALCADPNAQLDPLTSTPDIQSVFQVAAQRVQQQGCGQQPPPPQQQQMPPNIAPGAAAGTLPMAPMGPTVAAPQATEQELPPGWGQSDEANRAKDFKRAFVQVGFALAMPYIHSGMLADRAPPNNRVFISSQNGNTVQDPNNWDPSDLRFAGYSIGVPGTTPGSDIGMQQANAWVPDADSFDGATDMGGNPLPLGGDCPADGKETGPTPMGAAPRPLFPSRYCVRVRSPGFAPELAMRAALGYFVTRDVSLALITRFQFSAGKGTFSNLLLGARVEYMFTKPKARGLMVSGFLGGTFGQIQAQPSASGETSGAPWIKSGLQGAHIGTNIRYRFTDNVGMFMAPEIDFQFPTFLWNIDLTMLGAELAF